MPLRTGVARQQKQEHQLKLRVACSAACALHLDGVGQQGLHTSQALQMCLLFGTILSCLLTDCVCVACVCSCSPSPVAGAPPAALHSGGAIVDETGIMTDGAGAGSDCKLLQVHHMLRGFRICFSMDFSASCMCRALCSCVADWRLCQLCAVGC